MYTEKVMDHFQHPRNVGEIENASGVGTVGNAKCGDIMRIYLDIDDNGVIQDVKFKTFGCGAAVATSSMATEMVKGKTDPGSAGGDEQGGYGSAGRTSAGKGTLLPAWQRRRSMRHSGIMQQKNGIEIEGLKKPKSDISEGEEEEIRGVLMEKKSRSRYVGRRGFLRGGISFKAAGL